MVKRKMIHRYQKLKHWERQEKEDSYRVSLSLFPISLKEDSMSQKQYHALIARIRDHCQQTALDAFYLERKNRWLAGRADDYNNWYIPGREAFIALKKESQAAEPIFAFSPATEQQLAKTEQQLGFLLPPLLRQLYLQIANGGFGPGYGLIGAIEGFPLIDGFGDDIVQGYQQIIQSCTSVQLKEYEMISWAQWMQEPEPSPYGDLEREIPSRNQTHPEWEHIYLYELSEEVWPERMLPLCYWGCGICTYIDANTEHIFQCTGSEHGYILRYVAASLEEWLERWLNGESLQFL
jgi:hypothetical protein